MEEVNSNDLMVHHTYENICRVCIAERENIKLTLKCSFLFCDARMYI